VAGAVDRIVGRLRERLTPGEIVIGAGALIVVLLGWLLMGVIVNSARPSELVMVASVGILALVWLENSGRLRAGPTYRLALVVLGLGLGLVAVIDLVENIRFAISGWRFDLAQLVWQVGALVAAVGGWLVWREDR
jgi:hypothetical protein